MIFRFPAEGYSIQIPLENTVPAQALTQALP